MTTEAAATTDADDADINANCGAPATDASVWYEVTATSGTLVANAVGDYSAGIIVATGSPGNWQVVTCGPNAVGWATTPGETYSVVVFDDQGDGGGNGGSLNLTIDDRIQLPPTISATINPTAVFNSKTSAVTVSGTATCTGPTLFSGVDVFLTQTIGRFITTGFGEADVTCDGLTHPWSLQVFADFGKFSGGKALSATFGFACGFFECATDYQEHIVQLKGGRR